MSSAWQLREKSVSDKTDIITDDNIYFMDKMFEEIIIEKVNASEVRLVTVEKNVGELGSMVSGCADQSEKIRSIAELVTRLFEDVNKIRWPLDQLTVISKQLADNNELLLNPVKTRKVVFHTAGKLVWVVISLLVILMLTAVFILNMNSKLSQFEMNDVTWRYLKMSSDPEQLKYLQSIEKAYLEDPIKMNFWVEKAELKQKQLSETISMNTMQNNKDSIQNRSSKGNTRIPKRKQK